MTIPGIKNPAIPYGSLIVISGATGFIGSHVVDQALSAGYRVRGTTRNVEKASWALEHFNGKYGANKFELVQVEDMAADKAFDEAVKDASGFIHVANDMNGPSDPSVAIPKAVNGALNALKASSANGLKNFVFTSSSFAVLQQKPNTPRTVTVDTYNEEALEAVKKPYKNGEPDGSTVYSASKVEAERACFKWAKENNKDLVVNTVCPNANIGPVISPQNQGYPTTSGWVKKLVQGDCDSIRSIPPQHFINVQDDAKLHIIALTHPQVEFERVFGVAGPYNFQGMIDVLRKLYPEHKNGWKDFGNDDKDLTVFEPLQRAEELLKEAYGHGFVDLEESVKQNVKGLI